MSFSFSATPAMNLAGAPVTGQHSRSILAGIGYSAEEIDDLVADGRGRRRRARRRRLNSAPSTAGHDDSLLIF